jgi:hypothetical protein
VNRGVREPRPHCTFYCLAKVLSNLNHRYQSECILENLLLIQITVSEFLFSAHN